jgi:hypothetical protein
MGEVGEVSDVAELLDKAAIREVIEAYFDAATRADWDLFESLFVFDAVYEVVPPPGAGEVYAGERSRSVGARQIRDSSAAAVAGLEVFAQVHHGTVVTLLDAEHASARCLFHAIARGVGGGPSYRHYAIYYDDLVKVGNSWKFTNRLLQPIYFEFEPLPGQPAVARRDLR